MGQNGGIKMNVISAILKPNAKYGPAWLVRREDGKFAFVNANQRPNMPTVPFDEMMLGQLQWRENTPQTRTNGYMGDEPEIMRVLLPTALLEVLERIAKSLEKIAGGNTQ